MIDPLASAVVLLVASAAEASFFLEQERGWYWYEQPPLSAPPAPPPLEAELEPPRDADESATGPSSARRQLAIQGQAWEEAMAAAVLEPTATNMRRYLELTAAINGQAQRFASAFQLTLWTTPELDYTLQSPVTTQAIVAKNEQQSAADAASLERVSQKAGLVFVYRGDCPVCHRFAPILHRFASTYGFSVVSVSIDGESLPEYPNPRRNHAFVENTSISAVPALLLVNPATGDVAAVGYGYSDWSTLKQKALHAAKRLRILDDVPDVFAATAAAAAAAVDAPPTAPDAGRAGDLP